MGSVPNVPRKREVRPIIDILWDEKATTSELIKAQYGQYPPPGFPKDIRRDDTVVYLPKLEAIASMTGTLGQVTSYRYSSLSYEGSYGAMERVLEIAGRFRARPSEYADAVVFHEHGHGLALHSPSKESETADRAHRFAINEEPFMNKAYGRIWRSWAAIPYALLNTPIVIARVLNLMVNSFAIMRPMRRFAQYSLSDVEVETNLGVLLAEGVRKKIWERLPMTKYEVWAACYDSGLKLPRAIKFELDDAVKKDPEIAKVFLKRNIFQRVANNLTSHAAATLNRSYFLKATRINKLLHWREDVPYLTGHLYELMRLPDGRKRMGFDENFSHIHTEPRRRNPIAFVGRLLGLAR